MKYLPTVAGALLGLLFVVFGSEFFLKFMPEQPKPPEGSPPALFMGALIPTGYMAFVKVLEIVGGLLVAVPKTRNLGLLVLGPVIVNIWAFHIFLLKGAGLAQGGPIMAIITLIPLFLLYVERRNWCGLFCRSGV
jgi:putative oxidoreductase